MRADLVSKASDGRVFVSGADGFVAIFSGGAWLGRDSPGSKGLVTGERLAREFTIVDGAEADKFSKEARTALSV